MENKKFWKFKNSVESNGSELILEGPIASESWWGDEVTPALFREELQKHTGSELTVVINSGGGDVFAGLSIFNALSELDAKVTVRVDGLAASIASIIAMAGEKIVMSPGALMMVHKPSMGAWGDVNDLEKAKQVLQQIEDSLLPIYVSRTGLSLEEVTELVNAETWMSGERAVELGFADEERKPQKEATDSIGETIKAMMNGKLSFSMSATKESLESFAAQYAAKAESDEPPTPATPPSPETTEEVVEEETTETEVTEPVEDEHQSVEVNKEQPTMDPKDNVAEPIVDAAKPSQATAPKQDVTAYLKSKASMEAFARVLEEQAGKTAEDVRAAWGKHLEVTAGVTNPEIFLPETLVTEIEDAFKQGGEIWNRVSKTGADVFRAAWDAEDDVSSNDGRGRGYNRADAADKAEQVLTIEDRVLRPQFVYKYITLNKEDVKNQRSTGALVRYVLSELPRRIVREVERAIVIGDGRAVDDDYKIKSFVSVKADAEAAGNPFATQYVPAEGEPAYDSLVTAMDELEAEGPVVLIAKKGYTSSILLSKNTNEGYVFAPGTNLQSLLDLDAILRPDWFTDATDPENDAYLVVFPAYKTVGDDSIEAFQNFILKTNKQEYLQEIWVGGGLTKRGAAVAIAKAPVTP